jgi:hypothetical protein
MSSSKNPESNTDVETWRTNEDDEAAVAILICGEQAMFDEVENICRCAMLVQNQAWNQHSVECGLGRPS